VSRLTMLANTVHGLSQKHHSHLYIACVVPKILYGCPLWSNGTANQLKPVEKVQRRALYLMCAAFKTTSTEALEIEASIPPIRIQIQQHIKQCAIRFNKLGQRNPILQRLPDTWHSGTKPSTPPLLKARFENGSTTDNRRTTPLLDIAAHTSYDHERIDPFLYPPWRRTDKSFGDRVHIQPSDPKPKGSEAEEETDAATRHTTQVKELTESESNLIIYSDGSLMKKSGFARAGASVVIYHKGSEVTTMRMGWEEERKYTTRRAGLMLGAKIAVDYARSHAQIKHLHFYTDNSAAVKAIFDLKPRSGQHYASTLYTTVVKFLDDDPVHRLSISWCPGHADILGNERADELAKEANDLPLSAPISTTRANAVRRSKMASQKAWVKQWKSTPKRGAFAISNCIGPTLKPTKRFLNTPRETFGRLIQCRTGHAYTGEYRRRFHPDKDENCACGKGYQTREHILRDCEYHNKHRIHLLRVSRDIFLPTILGTVEGITALTTYLEQSGAFTTLGRPVFGRETPQFDDEPDSPE